MGNPDTDRPSAAGGPADIPAESPAAPNAEPANGTDVVRAEDASTYQTPRPPALIEPAAAPALLTVPWHPVGTGPNPAADGPVSRRGRKVIVRTVTKSWSDSLFGMSSQAAFWCAMSTAPFLLALFGLSGIFTSWLFGPDTMNAIRSQATTFLNTIFNQEVADNLIGNAIDTILDNQAGAISVGLIISLWAGSSAISAFVESVTIAYGQHSVRHPVLERIFALLVYVLALLGEVVVVPLLAIGPDRLPGLFPQSWRPMVELILGYAYYPGLALGLILLVSILYKVAPRRKHAFYRGLPGAALAAAVFLVTSTGLRLYLSYAYSHGLTYGALATPVTFLLFYYFVSMSIIIGAQFNNALLEYFPPLAPSPPDL